MLDAAVQVFSRRGYHAASMDEIAELAGISKPLVYLYLGSKADLFTACIRREAGRLREAITSVAEDGLAPQEQLWRGVNAFFGFVAQHREGWSVLYRQARGQGEPFSGEVAKMRRMIVETVAALIARAMAAEGVRKPAVGEDEVLALANALVGVGESLTEWLLDHPEESPEVTSARLMNLAWMGLSNVLRGKVWRPPAGPSR